MSRATARITGWCIRCGGECYDDGVNAYHRCPRKRPEADAVVALKSACARFELAMQSRVWAKVIRPEDCAELREAVRGMAEALKRAYPSDDGDGK